MTAVQDSKTRSVHDRRVQHVIFLFPLVLSFYSVFAYRGTVVLETSTTKLNALNDTRKRKPVFAFKFCLSTSYQFQGLTRNRIKFASQELPLW